MAHIENKSSRHRHRSPSRERDRERNKKTRDRSWYDFIIFIIKTYYRSVLISQHTVSLAFPLPFGISQCLGLGLALEIGRLGIGTVVWLRSIQQGSTPALFNCAFDFSLHISKLSPCPFLSCQTENMSWFTAELFLSSFAVLQKETRAVIARRRIATNDLIATNINMRSNRRNDRG